MKAVIIAMFLLLLPLSAAQAESVDMKFDISGDGSVLQAIRFSFSQPVSGALNYTLDSSARDIAVSDGIGELQYNLVRTGNAYVLVINLEAPTKQLTISYTVDDVVFRSNSVEHFFTEFSFEKPANITAQAVLPVGYVIFENAYRPAGAEIVSDGRRIALEWKLNTDSVFFSIKYYKPEENSLWLAAVAVLVGTLLFVFLYFRSRRKEDFLFGFRHDEKLVIQYLQEKKVALQRDLEEQFKFSRAKATRIVSKLVEKGLVKKQRYGRTNKLTWLK